MHWPWTTQAPPFRIVPAAEVEAALREFLEARWFTTPANPRSGMVIDLALNDAEYKLMSRGQLDAYLKSCPRTEYVITFNDCDDSAYAFIVRLTQKWGVNSAGFVKDKGASHAYNIVALDDEAEGGTGIKVVLVEPQTATVVEPDEVLYVCRIGLILI